MYLVAANTDAVVALASVLASRLAAHLTAKATGAKRGNVASIA